MSSFLSSQWKNNEKLNFQYFNRFKSAHAKSSFHTEFKIIFTLRTKFRERLKCMFEPFDGHVWTNRENLTTDAFWEKSVPMRFSVYHDYMNSSVAAAATPVATLAPSNGTLQFCLFTHFVGEAARTRSGYPCYPCDVPWFSMRHIRIPSPPNTNRSTLENRCGCTGAVAVAIAVAFASEQMITHNGESMCVTENWYVTL